MEENKPFPLHINKGVSVLRRSWEAQKRYDKNLCIYILILKVKQQKARRIFELTEQRKSALLIRTSKGTLSFGAMLFTLHKYCYRTVSLQGPEKMCAHSPIGTDSWKKVHT